MLDAAIPRQIDADLKTSWLKTPPPVNLIRFLEIVPFEAVGILIKTTAQAAPATLNPTPNLLFTEEIGMVPRFDCLGQTTKITGRSAFQNAWKSYVIATQ